MCVRNALQFVLPTTTDIVNYPQSLYIYTYILSIIIQKCTLFTEPASIYNLQ